MRINKLIDSDCKDLFNLRNSKEVRKMCFNTNKIRYANHLKWFNNIINSDDVKTYTIKDYKTFVGYCRFNIINDKALINIAIDKKYYGRGIGTYFIIISCLALKKNRKIKEIIAEIKENNIGSIKAFSKAGFKTFKTDKIIKMKLK